MAGYGARPPRKSPFTSLATLNRTLVNPVTAPDAVDRYVGSHTAPASSTPAHLPAPDSVAGNAGQGGQFATAASPYTPGAAKPPAAPAAPGGDLTADPILAQIRAAGDRAIQDASTSALAQAKNAVVGYGGTQGTQTLRDLYAGQPDNPILGALNDTQTQQAAAANPDSALAVLARGDHQRVGSIDQNDQLQHLYYSSARAGHLTQDAETYRGEQGGAANQLASALASIYGNVLSAKQTAENQYLGELPNAWQRAVTLAQLAGAGTQGADTAAPAGGPDAAVPPPYGVRPQQSTAAVRAAMRLANPSAPSAAAGLRLANR